MSEPTLEELATRLDDLLKEVRRQGRAAIAAQAAAESCLEAVQELATREADATDEVPVDDPAAPAAQDVAVRWLRAMIPIADAIDRIVAEARSVPSPRPPPPRSLFHPFRRVMPEAHPPVGILAEGLRVLREQLHAALAELGVTVDRLSAGRVDPERHRVVEMRAHRAGEKPGTIVEVVRPGYALGTRVVREAEVVATGEAR